MNVIVLMLATALTVDTSDTEELLKAADSSSRASVSTSTNRIGASVPTNKVEKAEPPAHIKSDVTYYDRKEGMAVFKGHVFVDDVEYKLHANRAYVFLTPSNTLSRIAAMGDVALTNGLKRAYGGKMTYRHDTGLVVLHSFEEGRPATVTEATPEGDRVIQGKRLRFWINREQVEVLDSEITTPKPGGGGKSLSSFMGGVGK